jgi:hypothetical protein
MEAGPTLRDVVLASACVLASMPAIAMPAPCNLPAPIPSAYKRLPEEEAASRAALLHYFTKYPAYSRPACVVLPGYRPADPATRAALQLAGVEVEADPSCRFQEGRHLLSAEGVWRISKHAFAVHVSESRFGDVTTFLASYELRLTRHGERWKVTSQVGSPCNPAGSISGSEQQRAAVEQ